MEPTIKPAILVLVLDQFQEVLLTQVLQLNMTLLLALSLDSLAYLLPALATIFFLINYCLYFHIFVVGVFERALCVFSPLPSIARL